VSGRAKSRADAALVDRGLVESRTKAQALIMAGKVFSGERRIQKAGDTVAADQPLEVRGADHPWVSRGGIKLAHGLEHFGIAVDGLVCLDLGASTGGFTDVLLHAGAAKVYAVDVGRGQLHWKLRNDPRVVVREGVNARNLDTDQVPEPVDIVTSDVSFIGLEKVLPPAMALTAPGARLVALIKPQFQVGKGQVGKGQVGKGQVGKGQVGKGGVVRDPALHDRVCREIEALIDETPGWHVLGINESPITGPQGNKEFLIAAERDD